MNMYFDDISVKLGSYIKDTHAPRMLVVDAEVEQNAVFNPLTGIIYGDAAKNPTVVVTGSIVTYDAETGYTVDTSTLGTFVLTYTITDFYGNVATFERNVVIVEPAAV